MASSAATCTRPSSLEGLAVYLSDGHFKPEPVSLEASALLSLGWYIPLGMLADNFYSEQHETGYLEGAALIDFMVNTWGWDAFNAFYRDIHSIHGQGQSAAIDAALRKHFGLTFTSLEDRFVRSLRSLIPPSDLSEDVSLTVRYYDSVREYQRLLDPSAYFRQVWLPDVTEMRKRGLTADLIRHPAAPINQEIEAQLVQVDRALRAGDFPAAETALTQVQQDLRSKSLASGLVMLQTTRIVSLLLGSPIHRKRKEADKFVGLDFCSIGSRLYGAVQPGMNEKNLHHSAFEST